MSGREAPAGPLIFIVAGEPSGDVLGARLMAALKERTGGRVRFAGVGGERMAEQGLDSLFPMGELSIMGLAEILPHIPRLLRRLGETEQAARRLGPDAVVTIDSPGFTFRLAKRLKGLGFPLIHYVAPSVWAWKPGRARKVAGFLDHLLALLPFEPPYFEREGLACTFVGHPVLESGADQGDGASFRKRHDIAPDAPLLCLLPGSRGSETGRLLPVFGETVGLLARSRPGLHLVVPTVGTVAEEVRRAVAGWPVAATVVEDVDEKYDAFAAADAALAASGTVALELAMAGTPSVVTYKVSALTAWLARRLLRTRYVSLVNILLDREVVPELLQDACRADALSARLDPLLGDGRARGDQRAALDQALARLGPEGEPPSQRAATTVLTVIDKAKKLGVTP